MQLLKSIHNLVLGPLEGAKRSLKQTLVKGCHFIHTTQQMVFFFAIRKYQRYEFVKEIAPFFQCFTTGITK